MDIGGIGSTGQRFIRHAGETIHKGTALLNRVPGLIQPNTFTVPVLWNNTALQAIRVTKPAIPVAARALAIMHTCMYTAWAAYDPIAISTSTGKVLRMPLYERTLPNKEEAISYAAYHALRDLFPALENNFKAVMNSIGYDPTQLPLNTNTPSSIGKLAAKIILSARHWDGSNQMGDLYSKAYSDYTHYNAINEADHTHDPSYCQWPRITTAHDPSIQHFDVPYWGQVQPFAMTHGAQFRPGRWHANDIYDREQIMQILHMSANLTDRQKVSIEYWSNGPDGEQPPGHWCLIAQYIARRDAYNLDTTVKLFFILTNALLDASIACWDCKRAYNAARPRSYIRSLFYGELIHTWAGPQQGTRLTEGQNWQPYQPADIVTPASPEYCSEHSTFSAASTAILNWFTGSNYFGGSYTRLAGTSVIEPGSVPATNITLRWETFSSAAADAGISQLHSGVHFAHSDRVGKTLGYNVAALTWRKAQNSINGKLQA